MPKHSGLGRGLEALIPSGSDQQPTSGSVEILIADIRPNPHQPRTHHSPETIRELAESVREHGVLQPLLVRPDPQSKGYILIAGERRWRAARAAGLEKVPAVVRDAGELEQLQLALIENIQREDLSPLETAEAYRQLTEVFNLSQEDVASQVGKSRSAVTNTLRLLKLPSTVQSALEEEKISEGHARALLGLSTTAAQLAALAAVMKNDLNVRQTEELVRKLNGQKPTAPGEKAPASPEIRSLEERLRNALGTKVHLNHGQRGGTLVIHYFSDEELNTLVAQILRE